MSSRTLSACCALLSLPVFAPALSGCCGVSDPDKTLRVTASSAFGTDGGERRLCGATVTASEAPDGGQSFALTEQPVSGGCEYSAVAPRAGIYTVLVQHPSLGNASETANTNPSCNQKTPAEAVDADLALLTSATGSGSGGSDGGVSAPSSGTGASSSSASGPPPSSSASAVPTSSSTGASSG